MERGCSQCIVEGARVGTSRRTCMSRASLLLPCSEAPRHYLADTFDPSLPGTRHPAGRGSSGVSPHAVIQQTWSFCRVPGTVLGSGEPQGPVLTSVPPRRGVKAQGRPLSQRATHRAPRVTGQSRGETGSSGGRGGGHPLPTSQLPRCHGLSPGSSHAGNHMCRWTVVGPQARSWDRPFPGFLGVGGPSPRAAAAQHFLSQD